MVNRIHKNNLMLPKIVHPKNLLMEDIVDLRIQGLAAKVLQGQAFSSMRAAEFPAS